MGATPPPSTSARWVRLRRSNAAAANTFSSEATTSTLTHTMETMGKIGSLGMSLTLTELRSSGADTGCRVLASTVSDRPVSADHRCGGSGSTQISSPDLHSRGRSLMRENQGEGGKSERYGEGLTESCRLPGQRHRRRVLAGGQGENSPDLTVVRTNERAEFQLLARACCRPSRRSCPSDLGYLFAVVEARC